MFQRIKAGTRLLLGLHNPGRALQIFPDDVFLVSFPKSGNTWTRFLIANLLHPETSVGFANIAYLVPDVESTAKRVFDRAARPRVIKSHHVFLPEYPRVIYIVRDPRDVAISGYHFRRKRGVIEDQYPLDLHISRFVAGETLKGNGSVRAMDVRRQHVRLKKEALKGIKDDAGVKDWQADKHIAANRCVVGYSQTRPAVFAFAIRRYDCRHCARIE